MGMTEMNGMVNGVVEETEWITVNGRYLATVGELTASGEYMEGTIRCVCWEGNRGYTIEKLTVTRDSEQGRIENWVHMGEAWFEGTALKVFELVVAREMS